jgi:hypothetical protein
MTKVAMNRAQRYALYEQGALPELQVIYDYARAENLIEKPLIERVLRKIKSKIVRNRDQHNEDWDV